MGKDRIREIFGIRKSYELPARLLDTLLDEARRKELFERYAFAFMGEEGDVLRDFFQEEAAQRNIMTPEQVARISSCVKERKDVERLARLVPMSELEENGFILNIPRYVDTSEPTEEIDLSAVADQLIDVDREIRKTEKELAGMLRDLVGPAYMMGAQERLIALWEGR